MFLHNRVGRNLLKEKLYKESFKRVTLSLYKYVLISEVEALRDELYKQWTTLQVFGRVYLAKEGINAQVSIPEHHFHAFKEILENSLYFKNTPLKIAVEDDGKSFYKLILKVKNKIVADGLEDATFDVTNIGTHLSAKEFNQAMELPGAIVVDIRNFYESEIGHFEGAICPDVETFREQLPVVLDTLKGKENNPVLLYCTGGIRCEKASAYLKHHGFQNVNQLHGGIISYVHQVKEEGLKCKFKGKNFVFDERLAETITSHVLSTCHQCHAAANTHTNCANRNCNVLFIQCTTCSDVLDGCCSLECKAVNSLPYTTQKELRKGIFNICKRRFHQAQSSVQAFQKYSLYAKK